MMDTEVNEDKDLPTMHEFEIFVPGRLCVLGEHTDWAGEYCLQNPDIAPGYVIVAALNEGLFASVMVEPVADPIFTYKTCARPVAEVLRVNMGSLSEVRAIAASGDFYSYVSGTVAVMVQWLQRHRPEERLPAIKVHNHTTSLPMKRGLSSSAAVCVLVAQAFNKGCDLGLGTKELMELAYKGEMLTPSRCGRMDQCVAMGRDKMALMTFKGPNVTLRELVLKSPMHFVVANLNAAKNTVRILAALRAGFPFPQSQHQVDFLQYPRCIQLLAGDAVEAIERGSCRGLGESMASAQRDFDEAAIPLCPEELASPRLHKIMTDTTLKEITLAIKGVGSQGDGSVQVLCADADAQTRALERLRDLGCEPFRLTVPASVPTT